MDGNRFDDFARTLAHSTSRRAVLRGLTGTAVAGLISVIGGRSAAARPPRKHRGCANNDDCGSCATCFIDAAANKGTCVPFGNGFNCRGGGSCQRCQNGRCRATPAACSTCQRCNAKSGSCESKCRNGQPCCESGVCAAGGTCCPEQRRCEDGSCVRQDRCCPDEQTCPNGSCSAADACCPGDRKCEDGSCIDEADCCPDERRCPSGACAPKDECCPGTDVPCATAPGGCCNGIAGEECTDFGCCNSLAGEEVCPSGAGSENVLCCRDGQQCCQGLDTGCCDPEKCCDGKCCGTGTSCIEDECCPTARICGDDLNTCCAAGEECCPDGTCMAAGTCTNNGCPAGSPFRCTDKAGDPAHCCDSPDRCTETGQCCEVGLRVCGCCCCTP